MSDLKGSVMNGEKCKKECKPEEKKDSQCDMATDAAETEVKSTVSTGVTVKTERIDKSELRSENDSTTTNEENKEQSKPRTQSENIALKSDDQSPDGEQDIQNFEEGEDQEEYEYFEGEGQDGDQQQYMDCPNDADREGMEGQDEYYDDQYYNDGGEQFGEEDEEETISELVPGPNGRMQYVVKGVDGRIKCIMDAHPGTGMPGESSQDDNGEMREQGENEEQYQDEEYYDDEEQGYEEGEVGQYEEGEIQYGEHSQGNYSNQGNDENYCEEDYRYMADEMEGGEEYYEEDEEGMFDEEPTEEQLANLRKQYQLKQQYLRQQKNEEFHKLPQQKNAANQNVNIPKNQQTNSVNSKHNSPLQKVMPQQPTQKTNISQQKTPPPQQNLKSSVIQNVSQNNQNIPVSMAASRNQNSQQSSQSIKDEEEYYDEGMNEEEEPYDSEDEDYLNSKEYMEIVMQQRMREAQNQNNFPPNENQEDYYDDEECYADEEEEEEECDDNEDFSDDPAIEAFIQKAIEQKQMKEKQVQGLLQYRPKFMSNKPDEPLQHSNNPSNISKNQNVPKPVSKPVANPSSDSFESSQDSPTKTKNILNSISMNNLSFKDKSGPVVNMVYLIRSNQGKDVYAMWDGTNFVQTPKKASQALPSEFQTDSSDNDSKIVGGGAKGKGTFLKGNSTGLNMTEQPQEERRPKPRIGNMVSLSSQRSSSPVPVKHEGGGDLLPNGRVWRHTPNSALLRRPLHPETSNIEKDENQEHESEDTRNPSLKRPLDNSDARYAACRSCGYSSTDLDKCERCARKFPPGTKFHTLEQLRKNEAIDRKAFYGQKVGDQSQAYKYARLSADDKPERKIIRAKPSQKRLHAKPRRPLNVTVTISSDDEYSDTNDGNNGLQDLNDTAESPIFPRIHERVKKYSGSIRNRMEDKNGKLKVKKGMGKSPKPPVTNFNALDSINLPLSARSIRFGSLKTKPLEPILLTETGIECHVVAETKGSEELTVEIAAGDIKQCQGHLNPPVFVMFFTVTRSCGTRLRERLKMADSKDAPFDPEDRSYKKKYVVVILDSMDDTSMLKQYLNQYRMINQAGPDFYEELSHEEANDLLLKTTPLTPAMQLQVGMNRTFVSRAVNSPGPSRKSERHQQYHGDDEDRDDDYNQDENDNNDQADYKERSPTPPRITFSGPIEKLLTYPPPPTKFALTITNEDLYCLNEGEFLNDVIIDFYLKYLLLEKMSAKDRERTHIFSSFFYKRLTQKIPKTAESSADRNKQPHIKRHSLVKTWTRHVDIFEKDFIVVPINEHSHWFLAIICFPGLEEPQFCPFLPVPLKTPESSGHKTAAAAASTMSPTAATPDDNTDNTSQDTPTTTTTEAKEEGEETKEEKESAATEPEEPKDPKETAARVPTPPLTRTKVITGIPLDPEKCIEESDNREYCLGKKQPCILVFDSLAGPSRSAVCRILKEYLQVEWDIKKGTERNFKDIRGISPKIPQQNNFSDCGIYVLQYVESFFECPIMDYSCPMKGLENWFLHEVVANKREDISNLVLRLKDLYPLKKS